VVRMQDRALVVWQGCQQAAVSRLAAAVRAAAALSDEELAAEVEELGSECASAASQLYSLHLALQRMYAVLVRPLPCRRSAGQHGGCAVQAVQRPACDQPHPPSSGCCAPCG
jgi:hypothetical protein